MKLSQIKYFLAVVDNDFNISRTVERVFIAQSAVSRQLKLLEEELGHSLFHRVGKRLIGLTSFGQKVYKHATAITACEKNLINLSQTWSDKEAILTIATTHTQAKYFLPEAITKIRKKFPNLKLRIEQSNPNDLISMLEKQEADIAICTEQIDTHDRLNYSPCYKWRHGVIVPNKHALTRYKEVSLSQVSDYPIVTYVYGFTGRSAIQRGFKEINRKPQIVLSASDTDIIKTYVRIGFGVGIIAQVAYQPEDQKDLSFISLDSSIESSRTGIAWLKNKYFTDMTQRAIEIIIEHGHTYSNNVI